MQVKGTAVKTTPLYVRQRFPERIGEWLERLGPEARRTMSEPVMDNAWYPLRAAFVEPSQALCELFFGGQPRGARELGRFSAELALKGLYRLFVRFGSPAFIVSRAGVLLGLYYRPSRVVVVEKERNRVVLDFVEFPEPSALVDERIAGWIERALELSGAEGIQVSIESCRARGDPTSVIRATWE